MYVVEKEKHLFALACSIWADANMTSGFNMLFDSLLNWISIHVYTQNTHSHIWSQLCISLAEISNCSLLHLKAFPPSF